MNTDKSTEQKIQGLEKERIFDKDVLSDPPTKELMPNQIDYLRKNPLNKLKSAIANFFARRFINTQIRQGVLNIKEFKGIENIKNIKTGAVITCNHFSPYDNFLIQKLYEQVKRKKQKLWKVIREGNYTNPPCFKSFFHHCDTLPLSQNKKTMVKFLRAINTVLTKGDFVLVYPEGSLWPNYKKPRPLKDGAFRFAVNNNVPVIPVFVTMENFSDNNNKDNVRYTINIGKPIYPNPNLNIKSQIGAMKDENFNYWKQIYENYYQTKLEYLN